MYGMYLVLQQCFCLLKVFGRPGPEISIEQPEEKLLDAAGAVLYQQIVESLQYLAQVTRLDICYAVN